METRRRPLFPGPAGTRDRVYVRPRELVEGRQARAFYVLDADAPDEAWIETIEAFDAEAASEEALLPRLQSSLPFPPWDDAGPVLPHAPEMRVCRTRDGRCLLVGEVDWPEPVERTYGEVRAMFDAVEWAGFEAAWAQLATVKA